MSKPILGIEIDFLSAHRLLVDPFSKAVLFASSLEPVGRTIAAAPSRFAASISHTVPAVHSLLASFPNIVGDGNGTPRPRHGVRHFVETSGRPVFAKARCLDPGKLKIAISSKRHALSLSVDASDSHVGGVLQQKVGNGWKPLLFIRKNLLQQR